MSAARHPVDDLAGDALLAAASRASGCENPAEFKPLELFCEFADVMERWGPVYLVHVRMPKRVNGLTSWMAGEGSDPLEACLRAYLKRHEALSGDVAAWRSALHLMTESSNVEGS